MQSVCSRRASWLHMVQRKCADARTTRSFCCNQSRSFYVISVLRKCFLSCASGFFKPFCGKTFMVVVLLSCCLFCMNYSRRTANTMTYCPTSLAVERAMGIIINNSGKFEHLVLMIAKRQTYRHRDRDIIQTCYSIVFWQRLC